MSMVNGLTDGFSRPVYLINGQQPAPLIEADEDDTLEVFVKNDLPVETTIHWHGTSYLLLDRQYVLIRGLTGILQRGTPHMDGVPGVTQVRSSYLRGPASSASS